jgi:hypothetical protein
MYNCESAAGTYDGCAAAHGRIRKLVGHVHLQNIALVCEDGCAGEDAIDCDHGPSKPVWGEVSVNDVKLDDFGCSDGSEESSKEQTRAM